MSSVKPNNYQEKIVDGLVFRSDPRGEGGKKEEDEEEVWYNFSICLAMNANANAMKQDVMEGDVFDLSLQRLRRLRRRVWLQKMAQIIMHSLKKQDNKNVARITRGLF